MILLCFDVLLGRAVDGGVETFGAVLGTRRADEVDFVFPPMISCRSFR